VQRTVWLMLRPRHDGDLGAKILSDEVDERGVRALGVLMQHCETPPASTWLTDYPVDGGEHGGRIANWHVDWCLDAAASDQASRPPAAALRAARLTASADELRPDARQSHADQQ